MLIGTETAGLNTTQKETRPPTEHRQRRRGESALYGKAHFPASLEAILVAVSFAGLVALMWITLAVVAVGLVNVAKWMVQTSSRHAVADGRHGDTRPTERPITQLEPTNQRR